MPSSWKIWVMPTLRPSSPTRIVLLRVVSTLRGTPPAGTAASWDAAGCGRPWLTWGKRSRLHARSRPGVSATLASGLSLGGPCGPHRLRRPTQPDETRAYQAARGPGNPETRFTRPSSRGSQPRSGSRGGSLDLDVHASRQAQLVEGVNRLVGWLNDVDQPLVRPDFKLLPRLLIDVRAPEHGVTLDAQWAAESARGRSPRCAWRYRQCLWLIDPGWCGRKLPSGSGFVRC